MDYIFSCFKTLGRLGNMKKEYKKQILLDRNVISSIRQKLNGQKVLVERTSELRKLDRDNNLISPFFSIQEGQSGKKENKEQMEKTINDEIDILNRFFKRAHIDRYFSEENKNIFLNSYENYNGTDNWENYYCFLEKMNSKLYQPIAKQKQSKYKEAIIKEAVNLNINIGHPIVIACLSTLYGCNNSRKLLKLKPNNNDNIYNALSDLLIISKISQIKALAKEKEIKENFEYFTFDKPLKEFLNSINIVSQKSTDKGTQIGIQFSKKLFPNLDENSLKKLFIEIHSNNRMIEHDSISE